LSVIAELKRRNVFRVAALYLVAAWVLLQVGELLFGLLGLPAWINKLLFAGLVLGFVPALIFSWVYELTPEGLKREHEIERNASITAATARKLDLIVVGLLVVAIVSWPWSGSFRAQRLFQPQQMQRQERRPWTRRARQRRSPSRCFRS
jgi:hypothetical protein